MVVITSSVHFAPLTSSGTSAAVAATVYLPYMLKVARLLSSSTAVHGHSRHGAFQVPTRHINCYGVPYHTFP